MKQYNKFFKESMFLEGTVQLEDADCNNNIKMKKIILDTYRKLTGKIGFELKAWKNIPHRYDILPENVEDITLEMAKVMGKSATAIVWDTVEVTFNLNKSILYLYFKGSKLDEFARVKY